MSDEPLGCLVQLIWLPYQLWKGMTDESRVGTSAMDREVGRFWKKFAAVATIIVMLATIAWIGF